MLEEVVADLGQCRLRLKDQVIRLRNHLLMCECDWLHTFQKIVLLLEGLQRRVLPVRWRLVAMATGP